MGAPIPRLQRVNEMSLAEIDRLKSEVTAYWECDYCMAINTTERCCDCGASRKKNSHIDKEKLASKSVSLMEKKR